MQSIRTSRHQYHHNLALYLMVAPGLVWLVMFRLIPLAGSIIAFQDYQILRGIFKSPWVGLKHFRYLFSYPDFYKILRNTLILGVYTLFFTFPLPIVLALMLNEFRSKRFKGFVQTATYIPYFFSWVIIAGFAEELLGLSGGVNKLVQLFGGKPIIFLQYQEYFRTIVTVATIYRESGWSAIIFIAAMAAIDPALYESAMMDGANRWAQIVHITLPCIMETVVVMLLLKLGQFMAQGFDRVYVFLKPMTLEVGDIFDTFVFRVGITQGQHSLTTAIGLFQSVVGLILVVASNQLSKRLTGEGVVW
ncbi:MAG TPA: ABC transporter permease subunit [Spirochaetia bacterium]|nr:ABC transporter permease subunit [Spirochaetia bacterium]